MDIKEARELIDNTMGKQVWSRDEVDEFVRALWIIQQAVLESSGNNCCSQRL